jgi:hypothetical protein
MRPRSAAEKELRDKTQLLRAWKKFHREERDAALAGPHGAVLAELFRMLKNLQHMQPSQLVGYVQSIDWSVIDSATKFTVIHEVNSAITAFREKRGLDPINDPLPPERNAFMRIKEMLFPVLPM